MLILLSPAKSLDFDMLSPNCEYSQPRLLSFSQRLIDELVTYSSHDIAQLMKISPKLAELNKKRFGQWESAFNEHNAKPAIFAFKGDVYQGLDIDSFSQNEYAYMQSRLRILSGLYGVLRPFDLMQAYRLEMGTKLSVQTYKNLYQFWAQHIAKILQQDCHTVNTDTVVNLASQEYYKSVTVNQLSAQVINPIFKDYKNGQYKIISFYAKKARGLMAAWLLKNKVLNANEISLFAEDGYQYCPQHSTDKQPVFLRNKT